MALGEGRRSRAAEELVRRPGPVAVLPVLPGDVEPRLRNEHDMDPVLLNGKWASRTHQTSGSMLFGGKGYYFISTDSGQVGP